MKGDFSRIRHNIDKHYTAVLQQQGRVALDADVNEQCAIDEHIRDTEITDIVGPFGGPEGDCGFKISVVTPSNTIEIAPGRYYVNGILCESTDREVYTSQRYLSTTPSADADLLEKLVNGTDSAVCVYLEVWKRLVTALDDPCLREPALGQADTTARWQTVWRVVAEACTDTGDPAAPRDANRLALLGSQGNCCCAGMYNPARPKASGTLRAKTSKDSNDCSCEPTPQAGYRGLENQLYRVEIHKAGDGTSATFKWSRENGSVVSAVEPGSSGANLVVSSLGPDPNLGFQANNWVELTDDNNQFGTPPNQPGLLYQVQEPLPSSLTLVIKPPASGIDPGRNARVRRWDQFGGSANSDGISVAADTWITLENGIQVRFSQGNYEPGDYWLIPARTATGDIEWPPCGSDGREHQPPYRTIVERAPLASITWTEANGFHVDDCRRCFNNLTTLTQEEHASCCTFKVGDGKNSFGDFETIGEAIAKLPPEGGEICVLGGIYYENVEIFGSVDITIVGCGADTRIASPSLKPGSTASPNGLPVVWIADSQHVKLLSLVVEADEGCVGVLLGEFTRLEAVAAIENAPAGGLGEPGVDDVLLQDLIVIGSDVPGVCMKGSDVVLERSTVAMENIAGQYPAVYAAGDEIRISENWVGLTTSAVLPNVVQEDLNPRSASADPLVPYKVGDIPAVGGADLAQREFASSNFLRTLTVAPGGIQVGGISSDIYILRNEIEGGCGNGITLGSLVLVDPTGRVVGGSVGFPSQHQSSGTPCEVSYALPTQYAYTAKGDLGRLVMEGRLADVHIENNRIRDMGLCGIGPVGYFDLSANAEIASVNGLFIIQNEIASCMNQSIAKLSTKESAYLGYGAISLADVAELVVRDNEITNYGVALTDPVCGIFVLHGEVIEISRNHITDNRNYTAAELKGVSGFRAGISIVMVTPPASASDLASAFAGRIVEATKDPVRTVYSSEVPALRIQENVVEVPAGIALSVLGLGAFEILGNHFASGGPGKTGSGVLALSVLVINFGSPLEFSIPVTRVADIVAFLVAKNEGAGNAAAFFDLVTTRSLVGSVAPGPVLFSQNRCSLRLGTARTESLSSVFIVTLDDLGFHDNQCWLNATSDDVRVAMDVLLFGITVRATSNRLQEPCGSVILSGFAAGFVTIASLNISSNGLLGIPLTPLSISNYALCPALKLAFS